MNNPYFSPTNSWRIPEAAVQDSLDEMALDGSHSHEGIVLWLGKDTGDVAEVTHLIRLRGPLVEKQAQFINIHPALFNDVADLAIAHGVRLVGQVHSHGPECGVDLSWTDRAHGIQVPFYLSLVAPEYAQTRAHLHDWGVHVYTSEAGYVRLGHDEARRRLQIAGNNRLPMLTVGGGS